jgi:hypothetical protein
MLSGLWHGANWTFVVWGALHGSYLAIERLLGTRRVTAQAASPPAAWSRVVGCFVTFHLAVLAWVFFRAADVTVALEILKRIATVPGPLFTDPILAQGLFGVAVVIGLDAFHRRQDFWSRQHRYPLPFRFAYALTLLFGVILLGIERGTQFIYFQF